MPSFIEAPRHRRPEDAPRIEAPLWVKTIARRVEQQLKRDWCLGFGSQNYLFRSTLNLSRTLYSYATERREDGTRGFSGKELEEGAISICNALAGKYRDLDGKIKKVNGDMTKIRYAVNLTPAAKRLLQNIEHSTRKIPGTQEVRKLMRYETHAARVRRGVSIWFTLSPDEKHNLLMLRLSRSRRADPANEVDPLSRRFGLLDEPVIDTDFEALGLPVELLQRLLPTYDDRRAMLARDPAGQRMQQRHLVGVLWWYPTWPCRRRCHCHALQTRSVRTV